MWGMMKGKGIIAISVGLSVLLASKIYVRPAGSGGDASQPSCPPCGLIFRETELFKDGVLHIEMGIRGEPKSGTGFMFEWATSALIHACDYLKETFGEESCEVSVVMQHNGLRDVDKCTLKFEPKRAEPDAPCACDSIERVEIHIHKGGKHRLPVPQDCHWQHSGSLDHRRASVCRFPGGRKPKNFYELWRCVQQRSCVVDVRNQRQMVVFRDPRAIAESTFYFERIHAPARRPNETLDEFVSKTLPTICQWLAVRSIVFEGYAAANSSVFWYEDTVADPWAFHRDWLGSVGLSLPAEVVNGAVEAAVSGNFAFRSKGIDVHAGQGTDLQHRSFGNTLRNDTLAEAVSTMQTWLPPNFLAKLGIPCA